MQELLAQSSFDKLKEGAIVPGTITEIRQNEVVVDIGGKSEGVVPASEFIDLGDRSFEVLHLPGHSPGSIALYEKATGILFSGDVIYDGPLAYEAYHTQMAEYVRSMKRVLELPVTIAHGGHFDSFGQDRLREIARGFLAEHDR